MKTHTLKAWPRYFASVRDGSKPFEIRRNDRGFEVGDLLVLREWDPQWAVYPGGLVLRSVTYVLEGGSFGLEDGFCVLGLSRDSCGFIFCGVDCGRCGSKIRPCGCA